MLNPTPLSAELSLCWSSVSLRLIFWGYKGSVRWEARLPRLLRRRVTLPHSWSQLKTDCSASGIITDNTNLVTAPARHTNRNANTHFPRTESLSAALIPLLPCLCLLKRLWLACWPINGLRKSNICHFVPSKVCSTLKITWMSQYKQYRVVFPPLISIDISPPCFSSKSTLISLINRPHYGQDCQKYFYLPRNILYCVNISLCLYFLWLSITATTNVSSAYKSIVLPPTK